MKKIIVLIFISLFFGIKTYTTTAGFNEVQGKGCTENIIPYPCPATLEKGPQILGLQKIYLDAGHRPRQI